MRDKTSIFEKNNTPIELMKNEAYLQTFDSDKKKRSNSSTCIIKSKNMLGQSDTFKDRNQNMVILDEIKEIDPEERRRRKETREKIEQKQLEHLRKMQI